ncbi:uncharacterized protein LOC9657337 [Selaginella moellendorffii]|uniref:uncharacterized protein LOC9657337 n=1 Tax=Selaginella moellendorffii TaxID=88036 RepID=UPI000D1CFC8D|nr:uncharacterized protein LOC9657337 [Selaginella moellendorffii]|eukprot:XP_002980819.2 uncharacterized protein LOC9657337 [Selaginella moellendorffii]
MYRVVELSFSCTAAVNTSPSKSKLDFYPPRSLGNAEQILESLGEMNERWRVRSGIHVDSKVNEELVCPKPRRPATVVSCFSPEPLKPHPSTRMHCGDGDVGFEILDIFLRKASSGESSNFCCSPPYFCGSPPSRAGNPLIHDVQFTHQRSNAAATAAASPLICSQQQKSVREPARASKPPVRVEGFVPSGPDSRSVSALA